MANLKEIFEIGDSQERLTALVAYARSLRINLQKMVKPDGGYSENKLAVLIYKVEKSRNKNKVFKIVFLAGAIILFAALLIAMWLLSQTLVKGKTSSTGFLLEKIPPLSAKA